MGLKRASHAAYDTVYHLVWCPKCRKKIFQDEDVRDRAEQVIKEICDEYGIEIEAMEVAVEHLHLLVSFPPRLSIGEVVRTIKSISARELFPRVPANQEAALVWRALGRRILRSHSRRPYDSAIDRKIYQASS